MRLKKLLRISVTFVVFYAFFFIGIQLGKLHVLLSERGQSRDLHNQDFDALLCKNGGVGCRNSDGNEFDANTDQLEAILQALESSDNHEDDVTPVNCAMAEERECKETRKIVFIKTHKTGSTTVASIIERFGYTRDLSFVVPPNRKFGPHILSSTQHFNRKMLKNSPPPLSLGKYYDILTNHVRYNRHEMDAVIPNATYVTIIRHPVKHFESSFAYFGWDRVVEKLEGDVDDPLATFMEYPARFLKEKFYFWWQARSGQLFDLGLPQSRINDEQVVDAKIRALDKEMGMVLINEYFDESLLILKKQLCWTMEDIMYIPNAIRSQRYRRAISQESADEILDWNWADYKLYQHFNRTLWQKIDSYGPCFAEDLRIFRERREKIMGECIVSGRMDRRDPRETRYVLKPNASEFCRNLWRGDVTFTTLLRNKQLAGRILRPPE